MKSTVMRQTVKMKPRYALLYEMGELTKAELDQLIQECRHEFDRANKPNFFLLLGPAKFWKAKKHGAGIASGPEFRMRF
jgi:hypothetical protein